PNAFFRFRSAQMEQESRALCASRSNASSGNSATRRKAVAIEPASARIRSAEGEAATVSTRAPPSGARFGAGAHEVRNIAVRSGNDADTARPDTSEPNTAHRDTRERGAALVDTIGAAETRSIEESQAQLRIPGRDIPFGAPFRFHGEIPVPAQSKPVSERQTEAIVALSESEEHRAAQDLQVPPIRNGLD